MAYFDYNCEDCDKPFEIQCGLSDDRSNVCCPDCGGKNVQRSFDSVYLPKKSKTGAGAGYEGGGGGSSCSSCAGGDCATC